MILARQKGSAVGIDIGSRAIRLVKLVAGKDRPTLNLIGSVSLPKGAISAGEIVDSQAVSESLITLIKKVGLRDKNVVLGVGNQRVIVRLIDIAYMEPRELASAIKFQAQDFIPIPVEDAIMDFQVIGEYISEEGEKMLQVILVAAHRGMLATVVEAVEKAGLKPTIIDVNAFALVRSLLTHTKEPQSRVSRAISEGAEALDEFQLNSEISENSEPNNSVINQVSAEDISQFEAENENISETLHDSDIDNLKEISNAEENYLTQDDLLSDSSDEDFNGPERITDGSGLLPEYEEQKEVIAVMDIGANITNLSIVEDKSIKFVRVIGIGGDDWTESLIEIMGLSYDEAEELKTKIGLPPLSGDRYIDIPGEYLDRADAVFNLLEKEIIRFIGEIRRSFEYYVSQSGGSRVTKVIFTGGASSLKNLENYLEKGLDVYVEKGDPFKAVNVPPRIREQISDEDPSAYAIAIGLALRGIEG